MLIVCNKKTVYVLQKKSTIDFLQKINKLTIFCKKINDFCKTSTCSTILVDFVLDFTFLFKDFFAKINLVSHIHDHTNEVYANVAVSSVLLQAKLKHN
jgi:hypothetical protein